MDDFQLEKQEKSACFVYNGSVWQEKTMEIYKIVITGGPCAGKTTAMSWIQNYFTSQGFTVLFIPETATELISGGVCPWTTGTNLDYQKCQLQLQNTKEEIFDRAARTMNADKVLIVCDRGFMDNKAYMNDEEFQAAADFINKNLVDLRDNYDAVFHLVTAADGAAQFYTTENNVARIETVEQAVEVDRKLIAAWSGHPHFVVIDNDTDFDRKLKKLIRAISDFLNIDSPVDLEKHYLIRRPDVRKLMENASCKVIDIVETYLYSPEGERSIRQRGDGSQYVCYETMIRPDGVKVESRRSEDEYLRLMEMADKTIRPLHRTRYCFVYEQQYFEIDTFPFEEEYAFLQIRIREDGEVIQFPPAVEVVRDITDDPEYTNIKIAQRQSLHI